MATQTQAPEAPKDADVRGYVVQTEWELLNLVEALAPEGLELSPQVREQLAAAFKDKRVYVVLDEFQARNGEAALRMAGKKLEEDPPDRGTDNMVPIPERNFNPVPVRLKTSTTVTVG